MTKREYTALADTVRRVETRWKNHSDNHAVSLLLDDIRTDLAEFCAAMNPAFHRQRWLDYVAGKAGPNGGKLR